MEWKRMVENVVSKRHRRLFVLAGDFKKSVSAAKKILGKIGRFTGKELLYVGEFPKDSDAGEERFKEFSRKVKGYNIIRKPFATAKEVMGRTYDVLVIDAFENFPPSEIGVLVETVRGPGAILIFTPYLEEWVFTKTYFHEKTVLTPPYELKDCREIYLRRVVKKFFEHEGVYVFSDGKPVKKCKESKVKALKNGKKGIKIPRNTEIPEEIYLLCATQDQADALKEMEKSKISVLLADRGRGKSASIGLFLAHFVLKKKKRIIVTAPSYRNAEEVFNFVERGLKQLGIKFKRGEDFIRVKRSLITFKEPLRAVRERADLLVVDEAAGIYVSVLKELLRVSERIIFSTTTHGYEGTGRLFQYRFLPTLKNPRIIRLEEPIRYGERDPIEKWLYDVFLLDAEPDKLEEKDLEDIKEDKLVFKELDKEELFLEDEKTLRSFIGIYVYAHYRNNPRDIVILSDAPNQRAFAIFTESGKLVCSIQAAEEGGLPESIIEYLRSGETVQGNIVPDLMTKYYDAREMAREKGIRIVRIAVHPEVQSRGIGSFALKRLEENIKKKYKWYGAVFGASRSLLSFWLKNGFLPVHISPKRNPESGEYSVLVLKTFGTSTDISEINKCAKKRLAIELDNFYKHMEPEVALLVFSSGKKEGFDFSLSDPEAKKLEGFVEGSLHYDAVSDLLYRLAVAYFTGDQLPEIGEEEKRYIVEKVLKKKRWIDLAKEFGKEPHAIARKLDRAMTKIALRVLENDASL